MSEAQLKERLHAWIDQAHFGQLEWLDGCISESEDPHSARYTPEFLAMLNERERRYQSGESKARPWKEVMASLRAESKVTVNH